MLRHRLLSPLELLQELGDPGKLTLVGVFHKIICQAAQTFDSFRCQKEYSQDIFQVSDDP